MVELNKKLLFIKIEEVRKKEEVKKIEEESIKNYHSLK